MTADEWTDRYPDAAVRAHKRSLATAEAPLDSQPAVGQDAAMSVPYDSLPPETDWNLPAHTLNKLQQRSIEWLVERCKHANHTDIVLRINGQYEVFQADWIKSLTKAAP